MKANHQKRRNFEANTLSFGVSIRGSRSNHGPTHEGSKIFFNAAAPILSDYETRGTKPSEREDSQEKKLWSSNECGTYIAHGSEMMLTSSRSYCQ